MATRGGKREGSGRKPGKTYRLSDYVSEKDRKTFVEFILENYMADMRLAQWMGDHLFSKPRQDVDVTTMGEKLPAPILSAIPNSNES
jgi:hypothetical protein